MILDSLPTDSLKRYPGIDIFRGVAIFTMLMANSAAESLAAPHAYWIRVLGSFAAPIFVFLAGFMVAIGSRKHDTAYFFRRALEIIVVAALIDIFIWGIVPFTTFDVLYLTALGIPVARLLMNTKLPIQIAVAMVMMLLGPTLQMFAGYRENVSEFGLGELSTTVWPDGFSWWVRSLFIDGWFPVFPWMGILILGAIVAKHGAFIIRNANTNIALGLTSFFAGIIWLFFYRPIAEREGYSELFYPPGFAYILAALGAVLVGVACMKYLKAGHGLQIFRWLGACSLFIYIFHSVLIRFVLDEYYVALPFGEYVLVYAVLTVVNVAFAFLFFQLKQKIWWKKLPQVVRFVFGG